MIWLWLQDASQDLRYAVRSLVRNPGFAGIVILTLAVGIGANTAIFSVVSAVLLRALPYSEPHRLVRVWSAYPERDSRFGTVSPLDLDDWRAESRTFQALAGYPSIRVNGYVLSDGDAPEELDTVFVTEDFFEVFGVGPVLGRTFVPDDHEDGNNQVAVLAHGTWRRRFGGDPEIVGRVLVLNNQPYTVVGVMPEQFGYPAAGAALWVPTSLIPETGIPRARFVRWLSVVGRLAPGVSIEQANAELATITGRLATSYPDSNEGLTAATLRPLNDELVGDVRGAMLMIFVAVGMVLLIACVNVANLVLARAESRTREIAVRAALGAGRGRLARQLLVESVLLAAIGGLAGVALAGWGLPVLIALAPGDIPRLSTVRLDAPVLAFTAAISLLAGVIFGLVPVWRFRAGRLYQPLKDAARGSTASGTRVRDILVVGQMALVVVVAAGAGLLVRSYDALVRVEPGFDSANVLTLRVAARATDGYVRFFQEAVENIRSLPGVDAAGLVRPLPLAGDTFRGESIGFTIPGRPVPADDEEPEAFLRFIGPGYFETLGIPFHAGRDFTARDHDDAPMVFIASRAFAERYFEGEDVTDEAIQVFDGQTARIVGMVGDVRQMSLSEEPQPVLYAAHTQIARVGMTIVVRTSVAPESLVGPIQRQIWQLRPNQPINDVASMETIVQRSVAQPRFSMTLMSLFAGLAMVLAAVGIYGVVSYMVSQRSREIGVRMALGATREDVARLVLGQSLRWTVVGLALGMAAALVASRFVGSLLYGIGATDPVAFASAAVALLVIGAIASLIPARRASRTDPIAALWLD